AASLNATSMASARSSTATRTSSALTSSRRPLGAAAATREWTAEPVRRLKTVAPNLHRGLRGDTQFTLFPACEHLDLRGPGSLAPERPPEAGRRIPTQQSRERARSSAHAPQRGMIHGNEDEDHQRERQ